MKSKSIRGGARKNAGRKKMPKALKKIPVFVYLIKAAMDARGGPSAVKKQIEAMINGNHSI